MMKVIVAFFYEPKNVSVVARAKQESMGCCYIEMRLLVVEVKGFDIFELYTYFVTDSLLHRKGDTANKLMQSGL